MAYLDRSEQETLFNFDIQRMSWVVYTTYPPHIKRAKERVKEILNEKVDEAGRTILIEGIMDAHQIRMYDEKTSAKRSLLDARRIRSMNGRGHGSNLGKKDLESTADFFNHKCALTGREDELHWDHVIPASILTESSYVGNVIPLSSEVNVSKSDRNIFEWYEECGSGWGISAEVFDRLIAWLADQNGMTVKEYREYVYYCHANPRKIHEKE